MLAGVLDLDLRIFYCLYMTFADTLLGLARTARDTLQLNDPWVDKWTPISSADLGSEEAVLYARWDGWPVLSSGHSLPTGYAITVGAEGDLLPPDEGFARWAGEGSPHTWSLLLDLYVPDPQVVDPEERADNLSPKQFAEEYCRIVGSLSSADDWQRLRALFSIPNPEMFGTRRQRSHTRNLAEGARKAGGYEKPRTHIPLVTDDYELRAAIALRSAQQGFRADEARGVVHEYAANLRVPVGARDTVVSDSIWNIVDLTPGGLPKYMRVMGGVRVSQELAPPTSPQSTLNAYQLAEQVGVSPRTVYRWETAGIVTPVQEHPTKRFAFEDIERLRARQERRPGTAYKALMRMWGIDPELASQREYDRARKHVSRRRKRGMTDERILKEAMARTATDCG